MNDLPCPEVLEIEPETRLAFLAGLREQINQIERDMNLLERDPRNMELVNRLFRSMHIIKGNCKMCQLDRLVGYIDSIEDIIDDLRGQRIKFTRTLGEAILLGIDVVKAICEAQGDHVVILHDDFVRIHHQLQDLHECSPADVESTAASTIDLITTWLVPVDDKKHDHPSATDAPSATAVPILSEKDVANDLAFFRSLAEHVDQLTMYWNGRTAMLLEMALDINQQLDVSTNKIELQAAVFLHDVGMAFLPETIINKSEKLTLLELKALQAHPMIAAELVRRFPHWEPAAEIILQHHERYDGSGYPNKLVGEQICTGAAILAVVDAFYSVTNSRADRIHKRSVLRAIAEINVCAGTQFDPYCVEAFNKVMRQKWVTPNAS